MVESPTTDITGLRHSPLEPLAEAMREGAVEGARGVALREIPFLAMAGIRVTPGTQAAEALCGVVGLDLPEHVGQVTGSPEATVILWQGPDEFLLVAQDETAVPAELTDPDRGPGALPSLATHPLVVRLARTLSDSGARGQVVDLSANRTTLELAGPSARAVLEKGCPVDLHPRAYPVGRAVSTTLGPVQVLLWRTGEERWQIMPRASFAQYTTLWLLDAMTEFAAPEIP
ncbi:sarcosine oxidase subunit gamma family protein [Kocuria sp. KSNUG]|uniref:sarcosine oxidase subunit gamma n=1 Tax=Kocuria sp. KSNUG TaxID=3136676 RepID=UPI000EB513F6